MGLLENRTHDHYNCRVETWLPGGACQKERVKYSINHTEYTIEGVSGGTGVRTAYPRILYTQNQLERKLWVTCKLKMIANRVAI